MLSQLLSYLSQQPPNLGPGLVRIEQYLVAGLFGVYLASKNLKEVKSQIFWSLGLATVVESALAIGQFLKGQTLGFWILGEREFSLSTPAIAKFDFQGIQFLRPYATFPHPNVLAAFLLLTLPLMSYLKPNGGFTFLSTILGGIVIILSVSRVALITAIAEAIVLLKKKALILLVFVLILLLPILITRFSTLFTFDNLSFLRREQLTTVAFKLWLSNPILGVGLNNFIPKASDDILVGPSRFLQPVHNIYLLALAETGLVGLSGFLALIGFPIFMLFKLNPIFLIWIVILFLGMFDHYFLTLPQGYRLLFLVWGLSLSVLELKGAKAS